MTTRPDPWPHMAKAAAALAEPGQPETAFRALDTALGAVIGHKLFTTMVLHHTTGEAERRYSNQPVAYPVSGRKSMGDTPWFRTVVQAKKPWLGRTMDDIRWAFFDHELIASLGCGSCMNLLVIHDGVLLGTINMLHEEGYYSEADLAVASPFAQLLVPAFLSTIAAR
jgi:hypothetical protein